MDEFKQASEGLKKGPRCSVGQILEALPEPEAQELRQALDDISLQSTVIARVLTDRGHKVSGQTLGHHRRKACSCG
jgi:hypothetical protein